MKYYCYYLALMCFCASGVLIYAIATNGYTHGTVGLGMVSAVAFVCVLFGSVLIAAGRYMKSHRDI